MAAPPWFERVCSTVFLLLVAGVGIGFGLSVMDNPFSLLLLAAGLIALGIAIFENVRPAEHDRKIMELRKRRGRLNAPRHQKALYMVGAVLGPAYFLYYTYSKYVSLEILRNAVGAEYSFGQYLYETLSFPLTAFAFSVTVVLIPLICIVALWKKWY